MQSPKEQFSHFAAILPVSDIERSMEFYRDQLGFKITFKWNDPVDYAVLKRGEVSIHLSQREQLIPANPNHIPIYIFVHDVDVVYQEFIEKEVPIHAPIDDREYQMRDFDIQDPDGHIISIGMGIDGEDND